MDRVDCGQRETELEHAGIHQARPIYGNTVLFLIFLSPRFEFERWCKCTPIVHVI